MGLHHAGFHVEGWDVKEQPRYPFEFRTGDALDADLSGVDFVWASPPCQASSSLRHCTRKEYTCLIAAAREKLEAWGGPWIIENVVGATLRNPAMLCGCAFGLSVETDTGRRWLRRHRPFESNVFLWSSGCRCTGKSIIGVYGNGDGGGRGWKGKFRDRKAVMEIDWMRRNELAQAIPPAYSEFLGRQIMAVIEAGNVEARNRDLMETDNQGEK